MVKQRANQQQTKPTARQSGWGYVLVTTGTAKTTATVTFPTPFAAPPKAVITGNTGYKNTGAVPTSQSDMNGQYGGGYAVTTYPYNITATGFTVDILASTTFGASYVGYTWIAEAA